MPIYINGHEYPNYDRGPGLTIATNVNPVSYTHLDVYKRQVWQQLERIYGQGRGYEA